MGKVELVDFDQANLQADILVLLVDHSAFKNISSDSIVQQWVIDTKGIWIA